MYLKFNHTKFGIWKIQPRFIYVLYRPRAMTQKIKVLDTSKHKDYDVSNLTNEELLEQIDVIAKEENVVNGMLKVIERCV